MEKVIEDTTRDTEYGEKGIEITKKYYRKHKSVQKTSIEYVERDRENVKRGIKNSKANTRCQEHIKGIVKYLNSCC